MTDRMAGPASLAAIASRFASARIVIIGDIMLDRFVYGQITRISPEAPVPVFLTQSETVMPGGAGNVFVNLRSLGADASILTVVGKDAEAQRLKTLLAGWGGNTDGILEDSARPTTVKTRFVAGGQQMMRVDREQASPVTGDMEDRILALAEAALNDAHALVLSDYRKGCLTHSLAGRLIKAARDRGIKVLADPKGKDYSLYRHADVMTPNLRELAEATGMNVTAKEGMIAAARHLIQSFDIDTVVVTQAEKGITIVGREPGDVIHAPAEARTVCDVSGVGDTLVAGMAAALASGASAADSARFGNSLAALAVEKPGTACVSLAEFQNRLAERPDIPLSSRDDAMKQIALWRRDGLRIGFTNGCFDILHPGHTGYLSAARKRCDRLIVGLNADESVRRLKGAARPVNNQIARAAVLSALKSVDLVVPFGDEEGDRDNPVRLIEALKPDIIFKGGDYAESQLPEARIVRAYGGDVAIMPLSEGHSTTAAIRRMLEKQGN